MSDPDFTERVVTVRDMIRGVADHWKDQYCDDGEWTTTRFGDTRIIYDRLAALDPETATPADVASITGNASWTRVTCDTCGWHVDAAVYLGRFPKDCDTPTALTCFSCIARGASSIVKSRGGAL